MVPLRTSESEAPRFLGKRPRLRRRRDFLRVQGAGRRFRGEWMLLLVAPGEAAARVGTTVSRKVGNAVVRNRVRRRLHEILRIEGARLVPGWDYVVVAFPQAAAAGFEPLREELTCLLDRGRAWVSSRPSSSR